MIDLTLELNEKIQVFSDSPELKILQWSNFAIHSYSSEVLFATTHVGTHIDAPFHFDPNGVTVEKIRLDRLVINENIKVIQIEKEDDEKIEENDLIKYSIEPNDTILINTNWVTYINEDKYFKKNPGLSKRAAKYLSETQINLIGIDTPNLDPAIDKEFNSHKILLQNNIPIIENLINLDKLLETKFTFIALPLKLKNCSGSPIRAMAIINR